MWSQIVLVTVALVAVRAGCDKAPADFFEAFLPACFVPHASVRSLDGMVGRPVRSLRSSPLVQCPERESNRGRLGAKPIHVAPTQKPDDGPVTTSPSGTFRGSWMSTRRGRQFQAYRGIRYAEPPIGQLRFQPPKDMVRYKDVVDASKEGPACPLPIQWSGPEYYVDEDCLTINVYTPSNKVDKPLPVIFFIHAGGFYSMTGRSDLAGPHYLLDRDVVFVAINYRLASLGFLSAGDKYAPGNNGFKDQVSALRWVQRNIAAFGGDPNLVTITGCSAGSISVMLHMISPMSKGLFHRGISMSASPVSKAPTPKHQFHLAKQQAEILNCPTNSTKAILDCLNTKTWRELGNSLTGFFDSAGDPIGLWGAVVEQDFGQERFLTMQPLDAIRQGKMHTVPYIISQTKHEFFWKAYSILQNQTLTDRMNSQFEQAAPFSFLLPEENIQTVAKTLKEKYLQNKPLVNDEASAKNLGTLYGDSVVGFGVHRLANLMCLHSKHPVYYYQFSYIGNNSHYQDPKTGKPLGAAHHDDMIYVFSLSYQFPLIEPSSPTPHKVDELTAIWYNFARYGDPNPRPDTPELGSLSWPVMKPDQRKYLDFGDKLTIQENMSEDRFKIWEELYPIIY
ncbi:esterase E4-like isoform X1 [Manduca sexta]|uniref:esterase E4-like isoform X1 n=1 Tax=Manduca sexta TaxID=7130 RepID=UPI00188DFF7B|nr:esterase E4-like isoform X1 [Manduca sexta]